MINRSQPNIAVEYFNLGGDIGQTYLSEYPFSHHPCTEGEALCMC